MTSNERMQTDHFTRCASETAADARRYPSEPETIESNARPERQRVSDNTRHFWPRTIWDFLILQLRIAISLAILIPFASEMHRLGDRLVPGAAVLLFVVFIAPMIVVDGNPDQKQLPWNAGQRGKRTKFRRQRDWRITMSSL